MNRPSTPVRLRLLALVLMLPCLAWGFEPFVIQDIRIEGLERISAGTVFNYLPLKVGETLNLERAGAAIRTLYRTRFFRDVRLQRDGDILIVDVQERPAIASIKISGNEDIETDPLLDSLKQIGLADGRVFERSLLDKVEQELQRQYFSRGKYGVKINTTVTPLERNRVAIEINVSEGRAARIKEISIVGNRVFPEKKLLELFELTTPTLFSFYTGTDQYSKQKLAGDLETLRSYYLDKGYINFDIDSTQVSITPDLKDIYITINISEGEQYRIREVRMSGDFVVPPEELFSLVEINPGDVFSRKRVTQTVDEIGEYLSDRGYAFANVNTIPEVDEEAKEVVATFFIDPGKRVYVPQINMSGNTSTRDEVLRREMRQMEGGWFSASSVERSKVRLDRLGFFEDVNVETPTVPGTTDEVDVNYSVKETPSGSLSVGAGFSQSSGIILNASVTQNNFLGSGNRVSFQVNNSSVNTIYSFSYNNPYYTIDGVSRGFGLTYNKTDANEANVADYTTDTFGGNINFGIPVNEYDRIFMGSEFQNIKLKTSDFTAQEITDFVDQHGDKYNTLTLTGGWSHDTRNKAIFADRGAYQQLSAEVAVPGLDLQYYKINARQLVYVPLTRLTTLSLNLDIGYGDGYGDFDELPFFENFFAGGTRSVRGYEDNTLGPRDSFNDPIGGDFKTVGNVELIFPPPFFAETNSLRLTAFFDIGNVYERFEDFDKAELRYSVGVGAIWLSPLGPLTFSIAQPLNSKADDDTQPFQFQVGTGF